MQWLRVFIPAWRFFDRLGSVPQLYFRISPSAEWTLCPQAPPPRRWWNLFFNPEGNLYLAKLSLIERFLMEAQKIPADQCRSFALLKNLVESEAHTSNFELKFLIDGEEVLKL